LKKNKKLTFNSLSEAAEYMHTTRQGVYIAIKKGLLKAQKYGKQWQVTAEDITAYLENKFNRDERKDEEGALYFNLNEGYCSVKQALVLLSEELGYFSRDRLYHLLRMGQIKARRKGVTWIVPLAEVEKLINAYKQQREIGEDAG